jgi:hypothetical protein
MDRFKRWLLRAASLLAALTAFVQAAARLVLVLLDLFRRW